MAAGKSTVGRALAGLLHWTCVDLDCEIERSCGLPIHQIFARLGEPHFRKLEAEVLSSVLRKTSRAKVIALGGGTLAQPQNASLLTDAGARVVFLEVPVEELLRRCAAARDRYNPRPLAGDDAAFCALYAERLPRYREAHLTVDAAGKTAEEIAREIAAALRLAEAVGPDL